jgi:hypothetical protein
MDKILSYFIYYFVVASIIKSVLHALNADVHLALHKVAKFRLVNLFCYYGK